MEKDYKIEIFPTKCEECNEYHYVILIWSEYDYGNGIKGFWHNSGICGNEITPELAFSVALERFNKYINKETE